MSKKLQGNGMFESSRMMLPEHKEAYIQHRKHLRENPRPQLDDQEAERLSMLIAESLQFRKEITLILYVEFGEAKSTGIVTKIDQLQHTVKLVQGDDYVWISLADIIDVV